MVITCGFCGASFREDQGQPACRACPLGGHCRLARCPGCGYENPVTPSWLHRLRVLLAGGPATEDA